MVGANQGDVAFNGFAVGLLDHVNDGGVEVGPQYVHVEHAQEAHDRQHVARFDAVHPRY